MDVAHVVGGVGTLARAAWQRVLTCTLTCRGVAAALDSQTISAYPLDVVVVLLLKICTHCLDPAPLLGSRLQPRVRELLSAMTGGVMFILALRLCFRYSFDVVKLLLLRCVCAQCARARARVCCGHCGHLATLGVLPVCRPPACRTSDRIWTAAWILYMRRSSCAIGVSSRILHWVLLSEVVTRAVSLAAVVAYLPVVTVQVRGVARCCAVL